MSDSNLQPCVCTADHSFLMDRKLTKDQHLTSTHNFQENLSLCILRMYMVYVDFMLV